MLDLHEASQKILKLDRADNRNRMRACCVNFRTVRSGGKVSLFTRLKYAINPLPISWVKKWDQRKEEQRVILDDVFITRPGGL